MKFNGDNNWIAEVSDEAAALLQELFPGDFREATEDDASEPDLSRSGSVVKPRRLRAAEGDTVAVEHEDSGDPVGESSASTRSSRAGKAVRTSQGSAGTTGTSTRSATAGRTT